MSETFSANPNNIQIKINGVDGINRSYQYNYINGTWSLYGMVNPGGGSPILPNESRYVQPQINYTIQGGVLNGNISTDTLCERDADFPMYDIDWGIIFTEAARNVPGYYPSEFRSKFEKIRCGQDVLSGDNSNYSINSNQILDGGHDSICGEYAHNTTNYMTGVGTNVLFTKSGNKLLMSTGNTVYGKIYTVNPEFVIFTMGTGGDTSNFLNDYFYNLSLVNNIYINWENYYNQVYEYIKNNPQYESNIDRTNNSLRINLDSDNNALSYSDNNLINLFGYNYYDNYVQLNINIIWYSIIKIYNDASTVEYSHNVTNVNPQLYEMNNWIGYDPNRPYETFTQDSFNKLVDLFTGSSTACMSNSEENINLVNSFLVNTSYNNGIDGIFSTFGDSGQINLLSNNSLNDTMYNNMINMRDYVSDIEDTIGWNSVGDFQKYITIETVGCIIQQQTNNSMENNSLHRYLYKKFNHNLTIKIKKLNEKSNVSSKEYYYTSSLDYPIAYANSNTTPSYNLVSGSGVFNTFDSSIYDNYSAGTIYNVVCETEFNKSNNTETHSYYNYPLNKQASCSGVGSVLNWTEIPNS